MLDKCCNPSCTHSFRYLTDGKLFRLEDSPALKPSSAQSEYFWLCPSCSATMTMRLSHEGRMITVPVSEPVHRDSDSANRKKGLLLSEVSILGRKGMTKVRHSSSEQWRVPNVPETNCASDYPIQSEPRNGVPYTVNPVSQNCRKQRRKLQGRCCGADVRKPLSIVAADMLCVCAASPTILHRMIGGQYG